MSTTVSSKNCHYAGCPNPVKWSVRTENSIAPDGKHFHLYTCDEHCEELTGECRRAGTRYLLRPLEQAPQEPDENAPERFLEGHSVPIRILGIFCAGVLMLLITPFVIGYFMFRAAFFGWRPPHES